MTLQLSNVQYRIMDLLARGPPGIAGDAEAVASQLGVKPSTVYNQLSRVRKKDWEARSFHGKLNSLIAHYPGIAKYLKVKDGEPYDVAEAERHLRSLEPLHAAVGNRARKVRPKNHGALRGKKAGVSLRSPVRKPKRRGRR